MLNKQYLKASLWFVLSILCGFFNDFILRYLTVSQNDNVGIFQASFLRFAASAFILLPFFIFCKNNYNKKHLNKHILRAFLLFIPMLLWTYGVKHGTLIFSTFMEFSIPLFILIIAKITLGESLKGRLFSTILGILGITIVSFQYINFSHIYVVLALTVAAILFATSDVINKHLLNSDEKIVSLLFLSSLGVAILSLPFAIYFWVQMTILQFFLYILQGLLGNLLVFFILKAYELTNVSALQPLRFISFPLSLFFSLKLGDSFNTQSLIIGMILLIISLIYSLKYELKKSPTQS